MRAAAGADIPSDLRQRVVESGVQAFYHARMLGFEGEVVVVCCPFLGTLSGGFLLDACMAALSFCSAGYRFIVSIQTMCPAAIR